MKWLYVIIGLGALALVTTASVFRSDTTQWHVCSDGCEFARIQAAVDAAAPRDTINIEPGTYRENIVIDQPLHLFGDRDNPSAVQLIAINADSPALVVESTEEVRLTGLTVEAGTDDGTAVTVANAGATLENNLISGTVRAISFTRPIHIINTHITSPRAGIIALGNGSVEVTGSRIEDAGTGIVIGGQVEVSLSENRITENFDGINASGNATVLLRENRIENNYGTAIWLANQATLKLIANRILDNERGLALRQPPCTDGRDNDAPEFQGSISGSDNSFSNRAGNFCPESYDWPSL